MQNLFSMCFDQNADNPEDFLAGYFVKTCSDKVKLLREENAKMKSEIEDLKAQVALKEQLSTIQDDKSKIIVKKNANPAPKKRGRPPKCMCDSELSPEKRKSTIL